MNPSAVLRSERLRPLRRLAAVWGVGVALGLLAVSPIRAQSTGGSMTPAGTAVSNVATVSYETTNGSSISSTGSVTFTVGQVAGVDVDPPRIVVSEAGSTVLFSHDVRNVGNGPDAFGVSVVTSNGWPVSVLHDTDQNGLQSAADTLLTSPLPVGFGASAPILVVVTVPVGATPGLTEPVTVSATSVFDGTTADAVTDEIRLVDAGVDPTVQKSVDLNEAAPGDLLTYSLSVRLEGAGARDSVFLEDVVPAFATYAAGTLQLDGVTLTDAEDADAGSYDPGTGVVRVDLTALAPDTDATILLQLRADADAPVGSEIVNRARLTVYTPVGTLVEESSPATTAIAAPELRLAKSVSGLDPATEGDTLTFEIEVENLSATLAATDVLVLDTLPEGVSLVSTAPVATMNGSELRWTLDRVEVGETARIRVVTIVDARADTIDIVNRATMVRDGAPDEIAESGTRTLMPEVTASLDLLLEAELVEIGLGETLPLSATVTNDGPATLVDLLVKVALPEGTRFIEEATLSGTFTSDRASPALTSALGAFPTPASASALADPSIPAGFTGANAEDFVDAPLAIDSFRVAGDTLQAWLPGELRPAESIAFRYLLMVDRAPGGVLINEAIAEARRGTLSASTTIAVASNEARALVGLTRNRALETRIVLGKVFHDIDGDGVQGPGEPGVPLVDVVTADGELVTTDAFGKFSMTNLRPGRHALRVDPATIPNGLVARTRGIGRRMQVVEVTGWNSPRVSFALDGDATSAAPGAGTDVVDTGTGADSDAGVTPDGAPDDGGVMAPTSGTVRVEPLRTDEDRDSDARSAFLHGPAIRIREPVDGSVVPTNRLYIGVTGEPMRPVALFRGEELIEEGQLLPNGEGDFIGVELQPGPQLFRVRTTNSWGNERWDSVRVHQSGAPATIELEDDRLVLVADGRTVETTRARLLDAWGVPVVNEPFVTVFAESGSIGGDDVDASSVGHQLRADRDGWVTIPVVPGREIGEALLYVETPDAEAQLPIQSVAAVRPLLLTGVGQISLGSAGEDFGAVTAQGRLTDETAMTLSYDSRRLDQGRDVFGRNFDPLEEGQQPILGDASTQRSLVSSRYRFSARLERGLDWLMFGDVRTSGFSHGLTLARYGRSMPGAAARVTTGGVTWNAFAASTTQALRQLQIRGEGSSGPYELGAGVLPGTEEVRIEVRALENPTRILSEQRLTRFAEYQIDYRRGILLLKQPVRAADTFGNPIFVVVSYEGESGGERSPVFGVRGSSNVGSVVGAADSIPVSVSFVHDDQGSQTFRMGAVQTGLVTGAGRELSVEVAFAEGADSSGVATRVKGVAPSVAGRVDVTAEWSRVGDEFTNPANLSLRPGTEELRASAATDVGEGRVTAAYEHQDFGSRDLSRSRGTVAYAQDVREDVAIEARLAADGSSAGGTETSSGAGEYKATWSATSRLDLFVEGRNELWSDGEGLANRGSYYGGGLTFGLAESLAIEARHLRVDPAGDANAYGLSSIGLTSSLRAGTRAWGAYEISGGIDGQRNAAIVGLNHRFTIGPDWRFTTMLERRNGVAGATLGDPVLASPFDQPENDYTSVSVGTEYVPEGRPYRGSFRAESRDGSLSSTRLATLAGDVAFNHGLALLSRQEFVERDVFGSLTTRYTRERSSLWGLAYRPTARDDLNILFRLGWKDAVNPFGSGVLASEGEESRLIAAMEAIWTPTADVELGARFATRTTTLGTPLTEATTIITRNETDFVGVRGRWFANDWLGTEVEARGLMSGLAPGAIWDIAPSVVGRPLEAIEVELGYRFGDLQDPDFAVRSGRGLFLTVGTRITEDLVGSAAAFWRDRFGG